MELDQGSQKRDLAMALPQGDFEGMAIYYNK